MPVKEAIKYFEKYDLLFIIPDEKKTSKNLSKSNAASNISGNTTSNTNIPGNISSNMLNNLSSNNLSDNNSSTNKVVNIDAIISQILLNGELHQDITVFLILFKIGTIADNANISYSIVSSSLSILECMHAIEEDENVYNKYIRVIDLF